MSNTQDAYRARVDEALEDLETIEDYEIVDTDDPEVISIIIKGRLKEDISRPTNNNKEDSDYDRAMKGITPL